MEQNLILSSSFEKFLRDSDNRIALFVLRAMRYQYSSRYRWRANLMLKYPLDVNYLTLRKDGTISYLPKGKEHMTNDDGEWARGGRQNGAPARVLRKLFTPNALKLFKDSEFTSLVNLYKAECDKENKHFVVYDNDKIPEVYCMNREGYDRGTLGGSCMNDDKCYLDIYKDCPHLQIVCLLNGGGELAGRALLWTVDKDGTKVMDRIYTAEEHYCDLFIAYAQENGWIRKVSYNTYGDKTWFQMPNGDRINKKFTVHTNTEYRYYPYIDTFTYGGDGWLSNENSSDCDYEYTCTSGGREENNRGYCEHSGEYYDVDDLHYIERGRYAGFSIHQDYTVYCETDNNYYYEQDSNIFEYKGDHYRTDDENFVEVDGDMVLLEDARHCELDDNWYMEYDCVYSEHHETYILKSEAYEVDGNYFHESVVNRVA